MSTARVLALWLSLGCAACSLSLDVDALRAGCPEGQELRQGQCVDRQAPLRTCQAGEHRVVPSVHAPEGCAPCPAGTFSAGTDAARCSAWRAPCAAGEREMVEPSATRDRACGACGAKQFLDADAHTCVDWVDCPPGSHELAAPSPTAQRTCAPCDWGSFTSVPNAKRCTPWMPCEEDEVVQEEASDTADYLCCSPGEPDCEPLPECTDDDHDPCTREERQADGSCLRLPALGVGCGQLDPQRCPPGTHVDASASGPERACVACEPGTFSDTEDAVACKPYTPCPDGKVESVPPDMTHDRVCSVCGLGRFGTLGQCADLRTCGAGEYVSRPPTGETDRQCEHCPDGTFSPHDNLGWCTPWTVCGDDMRVNVEPGPKQDRDCQPCRHALVSEGPNARECKVDLTVYAGNRGSCALRASTGEVTCWSAHLDDPSPHGQSFRAIAVLSAGGPDFGGCGILRDGGYPSCWTQLPFGASAGLPEVPLASLTVGDLHGCGVRTDGKVTCWGFAGQNRRNTAPPDGEFTSLDASPSGTCGNTTSGDVVCWGESVDWSGPMDVARPDVPLRSVSMGVRHACGLMMDDYVLCWGDASNEGKFIVPPPVKFKSVSVGHVHACGVTLDNDVECWGGDYVGSVTGAPEGKFASVSAGVYHSCGVRLDTGLIECWGDPGKAVPEALRHPESNIDSQFMLQHVGGSCLHPLGGAAQPTEGTPAVLFPACDAGDPRLEFVWQVDRTLAQRSSGACLEPEGPDQDPAPGTRLVFGYGCAADTGTDLRAFEVTPNGRLRHAWSGLCVQPRSASDAPDAETELVLEDNCHESYTRFTTLSH